MASLVPWDNASDFCDKHESLTVLKVHGKWLHEQNNKRFKGCSKTFYKPCELKRHTRVWHEGAKDFKCSQCSYETAYSSSLKYHVRRWHP